VLRDDPKLPGQRVRELIEPLGYAGSKTILDDYLREVRPLFCPPPRTFQRTTYRPGEVCQFDLWEPSAAVPVGHCEQRRAWVVVACLGWVSPAAALTMGALGVVFGDIGTSPLYSMQTVFSIDHGIVEPTEAGVYGVISLIFWAVTIIVSLKYVTFIMRAGNGGEGGIMTLISLVQRARPKSPLAIVALIVLGIFGASVFYGDGMHRGIGRAPAIAIPARAAGPQPPHRGLGERGDRRAAIPQPDHHQELRLQAARKARRRQPRPSRHVRRPQRPRQMTSPAPEAQSVPPAGSGE
jgi:hypothetical protein